MALAMVLLSAGMVTKSWAIFGLGDISYDGSLEVNGNSADNEKVFGPANDHRGETSTRVRAGMTAKVTEGVSGRVELVRDPKLYGTPATSVFTEELLWRFQNAYVDFDDIWNFKARLGRQYVGNPRDLVWNISPRNDDSLTTNSIDGLDVTRKWDMVTLDVFTGKAFEFDNNPARTDNVTPIGDVNLDNIQLTFPTIIPNGSLGVGFLQGDQSNTAAVGDNNHLKIARVGANGGLMENMITYRAEFFQNFGQFNGGGINGSGTPTDLKYKGNAIDLGVGYNTPETQVGSFALWGNFLQASGDDNTKDDQDKSFHDFSALGVNSSDRLLGEIFGKSNALGGGFKPLGQGLNTSDVTGTAPKSSTQGQGLQVVNIGGRLKVARMPKLWVRLDYWMFQRVKDSVNTGVTNVNVGKKFGNEYDLTIGYDHSDNVMFEGGYAQLKPDDALTGVGATNQDTVKKLFARAKVKWGGEEK